MAKVSIVARDGVKPSGLPEGFSGTVDTFAYLAGSGAPLHLYIHMIKPGESLRIGPRVTDCLAYVWTGEVSAGGCALGAGSSLVVEQGATITLAGGDAPAQVLSFFGVKPPEAPRAGGHVHLLPEDRVARVPKMGMVGVSGGMHFDSDCPTCEIWLHENSFTPEFLTPENVSRGPHCHTEDEIIFVTEGQIKLGNKLFGPGTALAVAADTLYSFNPGPEGVSFINFRAARPGDMRRANGAVSSETGGWQKSLRGRRPEYLEPA